MNMARRYSEIVKFLAIVLMFTPAEAELTLGTVNEGKCLQPEPIHPNLIQFLAIAYRLALPVNQFYVPMLSQHLVRWYAKQILGRNADSQEELKKIKLTITGSIPLFGYLYEGFPDSPTKHRFLGLGWFTLRHPFSTFQLTGFNVNGVMETILRRKNDIGLVRETIIWTDYRTTLLYYLCVNASPNFKLISLSPTISDDVRAFVLSEVLRLGFNESMIEYIKY